MRGLIVLLAASMLTLGLGGSVAENSNDMRISAAKQNKFSEPDPNDANNLLQVGAPKVESMPLEDGWGSPESLALGTQGTSHENLNESVQEGLIQDASMRALLSKRGNSTREALPDGCNPPGIAGITVGKVLSFGDDCAKAGIREGLKAGEKAVKKAISSSLYYNPPTPFNLVPPPMASKVLGTVVDSVIEGGVTLNSMWSMLAGFINDETLGINKMMDWKPSVLLQMEWCDPPDDMQCLSKNSDLLVNEIPSPVLRLWMKSLNSKGFFLLQDNVSTSAMYNDDKITNIIKTQVTQQVTRGIAIAKDLVQLFLQTLEKAPVSGIFKPFQIFLKTGNLLIKQSEKKKPQDPEQALWFNLKHKGGMCIHPQGGADIPESGKQLILSKGDSPSCDMERDGLLFKELPGQGGYFVLKHKSGMCIHPHGGSDNPASGYGLIFHWECDTERDALLFKWLPSYGGFFILQHKSGKCVHPSGGKDNPDTGTKLVFHDSCDINRPGLLFSEWKGETEAPQPKCSNGNACLFPFQYQGTYFTGCTSSHMSKPWCATTYHDHTMKVDAWCYCGKDNANVEECDESIHGDGEDYRGCQSSTKSGRACQKWTSQSPHSNTVLAKYPTKGIGDQDFCRNPTKGDTIWCYTTDPNKRWEYCDAKPANLLQVGSSLFDDIEDVTPDDVIKVLLFVHTQNFDKHVENAFIHGEGCYGAVKHMTTAYSTGQGLWCKQDRKEFCAHTPQIVGKALARKLQNSMKCAMDSAIDKLVEFLTQQIVAWLGIAEDGGEKTLEGAAGGIPEVGAILWAMMWFGVDVSQKSVQPALVYTIRYLFSEAFKKLIKNVKNMMMESLEVVENWAWLSPDWPTPFPQCRSWGDCTCPVSKGCERPCNQSIPRGHGYDCTGIGGTIEMLYQLGANKLASEVNLESFRDRLKACDNEVLNPMYKQFSMTKDPQCVFSGGEASCMPVSVAKP